MEAWTHFVSTILSPKVKLIPFCDVEVSDISQADVEQLLMMQRITAVPASTLVCPVIPFSVPEPLKHRRRWITHPETQNEPVEIYVPMASLQDIKVGTMEEGAVLLDLQAYYQSFSLPEESRPYYGFRTKTGYYVLNTIPTGHSHATGVGQMLSRSLAGPSPPIHLDVFLDNFRCCGNRRSALQLATTIASNCDYVGLRINDRELMSFQTRYDFLGVTCDHLKKTIELSQKSRLKLTQILNFIDNSYSDMTCADMLSMFGFLIYASNITDSHLAQYYHCFKFLRRRARLNLADKDPVHPWNCIRTTWRSWVSALLEAPPTPITTPHHLDRIVLFTDASMQGWGAFVILQDTFAWTGAKWADNSRIIAELEAWAIVNALTAFANIISNCHVVLMVDNTSCISALNKKRSTNFTINQVSGWVDAFMRERNATWEIHYVPSANNLADAPSRGLCETTGVATEW